MRADNAMAQKEEITTLDLYGKSIIFPRRLNVRNVLLHWFGDSLDDKQIKYTNNLSTNSAIMVERGLGYSVVIEGSLPFLNKNKVIFRPLSPKLNANCVFAQKREQPFNLVMAKFREYIQCFLGITDR